MIIRKNYLYAAFAVAAFMLSSCKDNDEPEIPGSSLEAKSYTTETLAFTIDGRTAENQIVAFTPAENGKGTITIQSTPLDISEIIGGVMTAADNSGALTIPTAGIIPGSPKVEIPVVLTGSDNECSFTGSSESTYCTFSYSGKISAEKLSFDLTDVKLKNTSLAGTWYVPTLNNNAFDQLRVKWQAEKQVELMPGYGMPVETILGMTFVMPILPGEESGKNVSLLQMYTMLLNNVTFGEDGSVTALYTDLDAETPGQAEAPKGLAQYVVADDNTIRLFLDPYAIIKATMTLARSRAIDTTAMIEGLLTQLIPMLSNGIPLHYGAALLDPEGNVNEDANVKSFYLGTETLLPILETVKPLFADEEFVNSIIEIAGSNPDMGALAPMLGGILKSMPEIIDTTSKIEIGVNLSKVKPSAE